MTFYGRAFLLIVMFSGASQPLRAAESLEQHIRFFKVTQMRLKGSTLYVAGSGTAIADGGKHLLASKTVLSSYPFLEVTVKTDDAAALAACAEQVGAVHDLAKSVEIEGLGAFTIESKIDPPLETSVFALTALEACRADSKVLSASSTPKALPAVIGGSVSVPAADLVAVPERYLDRGIVITGTLVAPAHFADAVSSLKLQAEGQFIAAYFTNALSADARLALVHTAPGDALYLKGTLTRVTPASLATKSGDTPAPAYEFDISDVIKSDRR